MTALYMSPTQGTTLDEVRERAVVPSLLFEAAAVLPTVKVPSGKIATTAPVVDSISVHIV